MIKKRGRIYWADFWVGSRRVRKSLKTDESGLALERARDIEREMREGGGKKKGGTSFRDFIADYLDWAWHNKAASSMRTEAYRLKVIQTFFDEQSIVSLEEITPYQIEQFRAWIISVERRKKKKDKKGNLMDPGKSSRATANRYCALLRTIINKAIDWDKYTGLNPFRKIKWYRETPDVRPLTETDTEKVLEAAREISGNPQSPAQKVIADLILFLMMTGLRKSEALFLRWKNVRSDEIDVIGKGERKRTVPLNSTAATIIDRQIRRGEYVFDLPNRMKPDLFRRTIWKIRIQSGVNDFHLHLTRHLFATRLQAKGIDLVTIAAILGHSRLTTSLIYSHTDLTRKKAAISSLET